MIGHLKGTVIHKGEREMIVSTNDIGYLVFATKETLGNAPLEGSIELWTHLSVREDALDLYGFSSRDDLSLFQLLIGISGIGPKSALSVLSLADTATLSHAIAGGDSAYLTKVSGIGKKLAQKIILELREKIAATGTASLPRAEGEALEALESLGYAPRDTREIVRVLSKDHLAAQDIIRKALQMLGKH